MSEANNNDQVNTLLNRAGEESQVETKTAPEIAKTSTDMPGNAVPEESTSSPSQSSQTARFFRFDDAEQNAEKSIEQKPNSDIPILNGTVEKPKEEAVPLTESKPEDEEQYSAEKKALMLDLIHEKKAELLNKIQRINLLNQQIAELDAPAERDVSALRRKIDSCFRYQIGILSDLQTDLVSGTQ